jgi:hypothetical protein
VACRGKGALDIDVAFVFGFDTSIFAGCVFSVSVKKGLANVERGFDAYEGIGG